MQRLGRKFLLVFSLVTMCIASIVLAYSINNSKFVLAATFIVLFVATFSVGLGPIPFVLTGELAPPAVSLSFDYRAFRFDELTPRSSSRGRRPLQSH